MSGGDIVGGVDCSHGAVSLAESASYALVGDNLVVHKALANVCGAFFVHDMRDIFVFEVRERGKNGIRRGLTERAERVVFDVGSKVHKFVEVFHSRLALGDFGEQFEHTLRADTAGRAFSARLVANKFHIELRNVDHTVVFVHNDCAAAAHHRAFCDEVVEVDESVALNFLPFGIPPPIS